MSEQTNRPAAAGDKYSVDTGLARPGAFTYIHIPATDVRRAAAFYRDVFGWHINNLDSDRPSFDDGSGRFSGAWISDHLATAEPVLLPYIYVADVRETVARIIAHGGAIVTEPYPEGLLTVSTFRDPAGNVVGLWHDTTRSPAASEPGAPSSEPVVAPVPEHLHTVTPRLALTDAAAAIDFYATAFDAREIGERYCAPDGTLIHAELRIGDSIVMITEDEGYRALLYTYWPDVDAAWEGQSPPERRCCTPWPITSTASAVAESRTPSIKNGCSAHASRSSPPPRSPPARQRTTERPANQQPRCDLTPDRRGWSQEYFALRDAVEGRHVRAHRHLLDTRPEDARLRTKAQPNRRVGRDPPPRHEHNPRWRDGQQRGRQFPCQSRLSA